VAAVWEDGRVVRAASDRNIGVLYVGDTLSADRVRDLHLLVQKHLSERSVRDKELLILDAAWERLWVRTSNGQLIDTSQSLPVKANSAIAKVEEFLFSIDLHKPVVIKEEWKRLPPPNDWLQGMPKVERR